MLQTQLAEFAREFHKVHAEHLALTDILRVKKLKIQVKLSAHSAQDARQRTFAVNEHVDCHHFLAGSRSTITEITEYKCFGLLKP